jgi:hypothetical protein
LGNKAKKLYAANPEGFTESSVKNVKAGTICGIIGLSVSILYLIIVIIYVAVIGAAVFSSMPWQMMNQ